MIQICKTEACDNPAREGRALCNSCQNRKDHGRLGDCATEDCTNHTTAGRQFCGRCDGRMRRSPMGKFDAALREDRDLAAGWTAHIASQPRPERNLARWWR